MCIRDSFRVTFVDGQSMEPTLKSHQLVLVKRTAASIQMDDIIVFRVDETVYFKRVVAVAGDTIRPAPDPRAHAPALPQALRWLRIRPAPKAVSYTHLVTESGDLQLTRLYFDMPAFHNRLHQELLDELYPTLATTITPSPYKLSLIHI